MGLGFYQKVGKSSNSTYFYCFEKLINFKQIKWSDRLKDSHGIRYKVSVDGTDCRIFEPYPFSSSWFSHKFHGPGVRYEIAVSVMTGQIVWVNGPFPCGSHSDLKIFKSNLKNRLLPGEKVIADKGYQDNLCDYEAKELEYPDKMFSSCRARHESVNKRIKQFSVASQRFRHKKSLHGVCFFAAAKLTQLLIDNGSPLFEL